MLREMETAFEVVLGVKPTEQQRAQIQERVAQQFGGERVYVPRRTGFVMGESFDLSGGVREVMTRYRVSRATAFRLIRRGK